MIFSKKRLKKNILKKINKLRKVLNKKIYENRPKDEILSVSRKLDKLIKKYY